MLHKVNIALLFKIKITDILWGQAEGQAVRLGLVALLILELGLYNS